MKAKNIFDKVAAFVEANVAIVREYEKMAESPSFTGSKWKFRDGVAKVLRCQCEKAGGVFVGAGVFSQAFAFETEDEGPVVIKFSVKKPLTLPDEAQLEKFRILKSRYLSPLARTPHVVMQNRADCPSPEDAEDDDRIYEAASGLQRWLYKIHNESFDCHAGNVGFFKGRIVFFDPMVNS